MTRTLWLDTTAGVAGDMVMAALIDAGADLGFLQACVDAVIPGSVRLSTSTVHRQGQRATMLEVQVLVEDPPHRSWASIRTSLGSADLDQRVRELALAAFARLAAAEAAVHGIDPDQVHFHEVGALDSIADVVGSCAAVVDLGITDVVGTPVAVGNGSVQVAHGLLPVPVPAVAELALGWPTTSGVGPDAADPRPVGELATPTGMALVRTLADSWGPQPDLITRRVGVGAGAKDTPGRPNVVRAIIGEPIASPLTSHDEATTILEANVDDLDPRLWPGVLNALLAAGALDAWLSAIIMKKGRPAHTVHVLCRTSAAADLTGVLFATTTTIGVREHAPLHRAVLQRCWVGIDVDGRPIRIKIAHRGGVIVQATPEFDDVAAAATALGRPELGVLRAAQAGALEAGLTPGSVLPDQVHGVS